MPLHPDLMHAAVTAICWPTAQAQEEGTSQHKQLCICEEAKTPKPLDSSTLRLLSSHWLSESSYQLVLGKGPVKKLCSTCMVCVTTPSWGSSATVKSRWSWWLGDIPPETSSPGGILFATPSHRNAFCAVDAQCHSRKKLEPGLEDPAERKRCFSFPRGHFPIEIGLPHPCRGELYVLPPIGQKPSLEKDSVVHKNGPQRKVKCSHLPFYSKSLGWKDLKETFQRPNARSSWPLNMTVYMQVLLLRCNSSPHCQN